MSLSPSFCGWLCPQLIVAHGKPDVYRDQQCSLWMKEGTLLQPIPMPVQCTVQGSSLQEFVDSWERQHTIHALVESGGMILLQLLRYKEHAGVVTKDVSAMGIMLGQRVAMPVFCEGQELNMRM